MRVKDRPSFRHVVRVKVRDRVRVTGGDRINVRLRGSVRF